MPLRGKQADEGVLLDLLKLRIDSGDNKLKSHFEKCRRNAIYTSPRIQNELINLCGEVIQENVISEVRKTMAYSILADETADVSGKEQLSIGVRFYDESKSKIREEFVGFVELKAQNASAIAEAIDNFLISSNLSKEDCVGFGFDGCSTMAGKEGGVQAILRKKYPRALYFHCSSHKLNLVVNDANAVPEIRNTVATVKDVITFFRESTTRRNYAPNLSRLCETRWSEKYKSIRKFSQHFSELVKSLETLSVEGNYATRKSAYQLHSAVTKPVFIVSLQTIAKYSAVIEPVVNALQAKSIDMISVGKHIKNIKDILRNDREFPDRISNEILQKARAVAMDLNIEISVPRLAHKQTHRSNPPSDNDNEYWRRSLIIPYIDSLISSLNIRFSQENTPAFALSRLHPLYMTKTSIADLHKNAESFQEFYNLDITGELNLWHNLWVTKALSDDQLKDIEVVDLFKEANIFYPAVRKALIILSTIPCTTATVERSFSTLRRVKTMAQQQDTAAAMSNDDIQLLENLIKKRGSVKFRTTHVKKYLDRIESDLSALSELDKAELRQKSSRMPQLFDEFASIQCEIETLSDSSDQFEERIEFENSYDLCMARINCILTNDGLDNDSKRSDKSGVSLVSNNTKQFKRRPINRDRRRTGNYSYYLKIKQWDTEQFFKYTRMTIPVFEKLLLKIAPKIQHQYRSDGISCEERLVLTLQYLSQGTSMQALAWTFHTGHSTIHYIIHETCKALWDVLALDYLETPETPEKWEDISRGFQERWNFPHCLGSIDGTHVNIQAPPGSGSLFYNYKKHFSIILLGACDAYYKFTYVDIGAYGSQSDGGVLKNSVFGQRMENNNMNIPMDKCLPGTNIVMPYFFVGDEAFPLKKYIMRPFPGQQLSNTQKIFNYRLSEHVRWRILRTPINAKVENIDNIVKATVTLHNYCQTELSGPGNDIYCPPNFVDRDGEENGGWRAEQESLPSVGRLGANVAKRFVYDIRNILAHYFLSDEGKQGEIRLCLNCLKPGHFNYVCRANTCKKCNSKHHVLLHIDKTKTQPATSQAPGSQSSYLVADLCDELEIEKEKINLTVEGINNTVSQIKYKCSVEIQSVSNDYKKVIECFVVPEITGVVANVPIDMKKLNMPRNVALADPNVHVPSRISMLIGEDLFYNLLCIGQTKLGPGMPILQRTRLGWIVSGCIPNDAVSCNRKSW
nr:unnamed protein product [Callosobruchus analis]